MILGILNRFGLEIVKLGSSAGLFQPISQVLEGKIKITQWHTCGWWACTKPLSDRLAPRTVKGLVMMLLLAGGVVGQGEHWIVLDVDDDSGTEDDVETGGKQGGNERRCVSRSSRTTYKNFIYVFINNKIMSVQKQNGWSKLHLWWAKYLVVYCEMGCENKSSRILMID